MSWRNLSSAFIWFSQSRIPPILWIVLLWFLLVVPAISIRGAHFEEGTTIGLARGAFEDGHWLTPFRYGVRFVERPVLISWLLAVVGTVTGSLPLWMARLPTVLAFLAGAGLVYWLVRQYASIRAAMFGAICFLISPMMLQKTVTVEVDGVVSVLLFAGFVTWWIGHSRGSPTAARWLVLTIVLSTATLVKGPQPLGYFFIGIGSYLILKRRWLELIALALSGVLCGSVAWGWYWAVYQPGDLAVWFAHSRLNASKSVGSYFAGAGNFVVQLLFELLPGVLLAAPLAIDLARRRFTGNRDLVLSLFLYGGVCSVILVFWPSARTRYAMPSVLAFAAVAGLAFDYLLVQQRKIIEVAQAVAACLFTYALVVSWLIMPFVSSIYNPETRRHGDDMALTIAQRPGMLYVTPEALDNNLLVYIRTPVHTASFDTIQRIEPPFFALVTPVQEQLLRTSKGDSRTILHASFHLKSREKCFVEILSP